MTALERPARTAPADDLPPLRDGDRMDRVEFERRWFAMPEPRRNAELLEGVVHFMPPAYEDSHSGPHADVIGLLYNYRVATPGTFSGGPGSLRLDRPNMPEPDAYLRILESHGGQSHRAADGCVEGMPELVVEIAGATVRKDLGLKFGIYRRNGVREYVVWETEAGRLHWFVRRDEALDPLWADDDGVFRSETFGGLWIDAAALVRGDSAAALRTLQAGLASPQHAEFVERLKAAASPKDK